MPVTRAPYSFLVPHTREEKDAFALAAAFWIWFVIAGELAWWLEPFAHYTDIGNVLPR